MDAARHITYRLGMLRYQLIHTYARVPDRSGFVPYADGVMLSRSRYITASGGSAKVVVTCTAIRRSSIRVRRGHLLGIRQPSTVSVLGSVARRSAHGRLREQA